MNVDSQQEKMPESELLDFALILNRQTDYNEMLRFVVARTKDLLCAESCLMMMINPSTGETIKTVLNQGGQIQSHGLVSAQAQITGWMLRERTPFISENIITDPRFSRFPKAHTPLPIISAVLLQVENMVIGSLIVFRNNTSPNFTEHDLMILEYIAAAASPYLRNIKKMKEFFAPALSQDTLLNKYAAQGLIGVSDAFVGLLHSIEAAARCDVRVVLEGESGTGKELIARAIHRFSARHSSPFVAIDCGAIPAHLMESELFGYKKGAFTGATQDRLGLIEAAEGGTLFIDEISNLPLEMQAKLMRYLQEGEVRPLGSNSPKKVNVRTISASSRPMNDLVKAGDFRQDLYFRLHVYPIYIPNLAERTHDIALLANFFLKRFSDQQSKSLDSIHPGLIAHLKQQHWAGNIRELENFVERLVSLAPQDATVLTLDDLPIAAHPGKSNIKDQQVAKKTSLKTQLFKYEKQIISQALVKSGWNQSKAARLLEMSEALIRFRMKKLGIERKSDH